MSHPAVRRPLLTCVVIGFCFLAFLPSRAQPPSPSGQGGQQPPAESKPVPSPHQVTATPVYAFAAPPHLKYNRVYRVNRSLGDVIACQYAREPGVGRTVCFPSGEGAGPQGPGNYALVPSHHEEESGVFRVNLRTGQVSLCYVPNDKTVCTEAAP